MGEALSRLTPVTLEQLDRAQLHERVESKVIMRADAVPATLSRLRPGYFVMEHAYTRLQRYSNAYFDTRTCATTARTTTSDAAARRCATGATWTRT